MSQGLLWTRINLEFSTLDIPNPELLKLGRQIAKASTISWRNNLWPSLCNLVFLPTCQIQCTSKGQSAPQLGKVHLGQFGHLLESYLARTCKFHHLLQCWPLCSIFFQPLPSLSGDLRIFSSLRFLFLLYLQLAFVFLFWQIPDKSWLGRTVATSEGHAPSYEPSTE